MNVTARLPWSGTATKRGVMVLAVVAMVVLTAGCTGLLSEQADADADASKQTAKAPADAEVLVNVDMALFTDDETHTLLEDTDEGGMSTVQEVDTLYTEFEDDTGLDLADLNQTTVFGWAGDDPRTAEEVGILLDAEWDTETTIDAMRQDSDIELVRTEYAGEDVLWEPANPDQHDDPMYVGVHDDGQFVVGTEAAVTASLDVSYNGAEPVSGALLTAFENTPEGLVTFATDSTQPATEMGGESATSGLETMTGSYDTEDGEITLETHLTYEETQQAADMQQAIPFLTDMARSELDAPEQQLLDEIETNTDDSTLVVTWSVSAETLVQLANEQ